MSDQDPRQQLTAGFSELSRILADLRPDTFKLHIKLLTFHSLEFNERWSDFVNATSTLGEAELKNAESIRKKLADVTESRAGTLAKLKQTEAAIEDAEAAGQALDGQERELSAGLAKLENAEATLKDLEENNENLEERIAGLDQNLLQSKSAFLESNGPRTAKIEQSHLDNLERLLSDRVEIIEMVSQALSIISETTDRDTKALDAASHSLRFQPDDIAQLSQELSAVRRELMAFESLYLRAIQTAEELS
jgi:DNA repair exonuclease SbcCD ATPase subunit